MTLLKTAILILAIARDKWVIVKEKSAIASGSIRLNYKDRSVDSVLHEEKSCYYRSLTVNRMFRPRIKGITR